MAEAYINKYGYPLCETCAELAKTYRKWSICKVYSKQEEIQFCNECGVFLEATLSETGILSLISKTRDATLELLSPTPSPALSYRYISGPYLGEDGYAPLNAALKYYGAGRVVNKRFQFFFKVFTTAYNFLRYPQDD